MSARSMRAALRRLAVLPLIALAVALVATLVGPASTASAATGREQRGANIALAQRGDPYRYGAAGPNAFDCSGLVYYSYRKAGFHHIARTAAAQAHQSRHIAKRSMHKGDLMFFTSGGHVYHAAIFLRWFHGRAIMLHSPHSGSTVHIERAWTNSWFAGRMR